MSDVRYDRIGTTYGRHRQADPRIAARIEAALGGARSVVNVGAGSGSYEPRDARVVAVEPSRVMLRQRPDGAAPAVHGVAEALPFADASFDAALAILTVHHWRDLARGLDEMRRVARRRRIVLTWAPEIAARFWLVHDYLPEIAAAERGLATVAHVVDALPGSEVVTLPVPHDCRDGFLGAYWRRPEAYLDPSVRGAISGLARLDARVVDAAVARLASDLASGAWHERHRELLGRDEVDLGYRLVVHGAG